MCYRYQENDRNIHNFNDTFLVAFDVDHFLRQCLQEHLPIGSIMNVLNQGLHLCHQPTMNLPTIENSSPYDL